MKIGILADIHAHTGNLKKAVARLRKADVDVFVVLGDVIYNRTNATETVAMLRDCEAIGVWGNHELGLCVEPDADVCAGYDDSVLSFLGTLAPNLELGGCLFSHTFPNEDARDPLSYYVDRLPDEEDALDGCFSTLPHRLMMIGHFHRWFAANTSGPIAWNGERTIELEPKERYFVVIGAVMDGQAAIVDTAQNVLIPVLV